MSKQDRLYELVAPAVTALGFELVGLELVQHGRSATLRIYIDHPNKVNVDDCAKVSYQVGSILDVEDPIQGEYRLEVSSPGIDRPLFTAAHYVAVVGQVIKLKMAVPHKGRRNFKGLLNGVKGESIVLTVDKETVELPLSQVERGNLVPDYEALLKEANAKGLH
ncbi:MAG: ribosome maturation factor RimP [Gammaproteobacteria bacterium]|nr:ribosome maturation factor RimP [Gammaproteobacteria bacterium]